MKVCPRCFTRFPDAPQFVPEAIRTPGYPVFLAALDLAFGLRKQSYALDLFVTNVLDKRGELFRFNQCASCSIVANYAVPTQPRTIALAAASLTWRRRSASRL